MALEIKSRTHKRGTVVGRHVSGLEYVSYEGLNYFEEGTQFAGPSRIEIGLCTTVGHGSSLTGPLKIGNYCQLAPGCAVHTGDHPVEQVALYTNHRLLNGVMTQYIAPEPVVIGHGVWLASGVNVMKGVEIGNGAVIGAGAVVTRSVPAYAVALGTPAKVLKMRLADPVIHIVEASRWWEFHPGELEEFREFFEIDLRFATASDLDRLQAVADRMTERRSRGR
jgi:acetyltransferase-like isoleucine patch superfamily enzyme